jgi:ribose 5-phosphate isomerase B
MIYIGADHRGFELKEFIYQRLKDEGYEVTDLGNHVLDPQDDYVDFARSVGEAVVNDPHGRGVVLCGSGAGVDMVANKIDGVRSALAFDIPRAKQAREHEDANVVSLPADILDPELAYEIVKVFLETPFTDEERHVRRLEKMEDVEETHQ